MNNMFIKFKAILVVSIVMLLLTACIPRSMHEIVIDNMTIELKSWNATILWFDKKDNILYAEHTKDLKFEIPYRIITEEEKDELYEQEEYLTPRYDTPTTNGNLIAKSEEDGVVIMHWLVPVINENYEPQGYWVYLEAPVDEEYKEELIRYTVYDDGVSDRVSGNLTAQIIEAEEE